MVERKEIPQPGQESRLIQIRTMILHHYAGLKKALKKENEEDRSQMRCRAVTMAILSTIPIGFHLARYDSVSKAQQQATTFFGGDLEYNVYDVGCGGKVLVDAINVYLGISEVSRYATVQQPLCLPGEVSTLCPEGESIEPTTPIRVLQGAELADSIILPTEEVEETFESAYLKALEGLPAAVNSKFGILNDDNSENTLVTVDPEQLAQEEAQLQAATIIYRQAASWSDEQAAIDYQLELLQDCDADCQLKGSRWSHVYIVNGIWLIFICLNMIGVVVSTYGSRQALLRTIMAIVSFALCLGHFAIIIATASYRFSTFSQLCALNKAPTALASSDETPTDAWTFVKDGILIIILWVLQLLTFLVCFSVGVMPVKIYVRPSGPPKNATTELGGRRSSQRRSGRQARIHERTWVEQPRQMQVPQQAPAQYAVKTSVRSQLS